MKFLHSHWSRYLYELMRPCQSVGWCSPQLVYFGCWHPCQTLPTLLQHYFHQCLWNQAAVQSLPSLYLANWPALYFASSCSCSCCWQLHWLVGHCTPLSPPAPLFSHCKPHPPLLHHSARSIWPRCKKCLHPLAPSPSCLPLQLMPEN